LKITIPLHLRFMIISPTIIKKNWSKPFLLLNLK
jgi:hypothetical protein